MKDWWPWLAKLQNKHKQDYSELLAVKAWKLHPQMDVKFLSQSKKSCRDPHVCQSPCTEFQDVACASDPCAYSRSYVSFWSLLLQRGKFLLAYPQILDDQGILFSWALVYFPRVLLPVGTLSDGTIEESRQRTTAAAKSTSATVWLGCCTSHDFLSTRDAVMVWQYQRRHFSSNPEWIQMFTTWYVHCIASQSANQHTQAFFAVDNILGSIKKKFH